MTQQAIDVLIVGAGPVGLTLGILLKRLGVEAAIVERRRDLAKPPAAHVVNARTFEILRQAGVDMAAIDAVAKDPRDAGAVHWVTRLGGEVLGTLPFERQGDDVLAFTPTPLRNLSQHRFEPVLRKALVDCGASAPELGTEWIGATDDGEFVTSTLRDTASGETRTVRSRYLLAADGAGSPVRKSLGIAMNGPDVLQHFVMVHVEADLRRVVGDATGVLYWVCDPDARGTFIAHDIDREWVWMLEWSGVGDPPGREACEASVRAAIARDDVTLRVLHASPWVMTCQVAERYRSGRTFLVGDAAHRFPPTGGLGLNTGVQEAHNLAWKLAAVLSGRADDRLLDTYEGERLAVAAWNSQQSLENAMRLFEIPQALGFDPDPAEARRGYEATLRDPSRRIALARAIVNQATHFDMLGLQLGYRYEAGAFLAAPADDLDRDADDPVREFLPGSRHGARLPHGWLRRGEGVPPVSSLDLVPIDRPVLLVGSDAGTWLEAAAVQCAPLEVVRVGTDVEDADGWWSRVLGLEADGALLVRPDQHVAMRARRAVEDPRLALDAALRAIFPGDAGAGAVPGGANRAIG